MSSVTLDLVTMYVTNYVNEKHLFNVATGAQYAHPVRAGQFSVSGLWTGWHHCSTHNCLEPTSRSSGVTLRYFRENIAHQSQAPNDPGRIWHQQNVTVTQEKRSAEVQRILDQDVNIPNDLWNEKVFLSLILSQIWLTGSLPGWLERMATCQQMRWTCWVGNIRTVWFFYGTRDHRQGDSNAVRKTANTCGKNRYKLTRRRADLLPYFYVWDLTLKVFIIIKVAIFQLMYYPVSRFLTFSSGILLWTTFSLKSKNPSQPEWPANVYLFTTFTITTWCEAGFVAPQAVKVVLPHMGNSEGTGRWMSGPKK